MRVSKQCSVRALFKFKINQNIEKKNAEVNSFIVMNEDEFILPFETNVSIDEGSFETDIICRAAEKEYFFKYFVFTVRGIRKIVVIDYEVNLNIIASFVSDGEDAVCAKIMLNGYTLALVRFKISDDVSIETLKKLAIEKNPMFKVII